MFGIDPSASKVMASRQFQEFTWAVSHIVEQGDSDVYAAGRYNQTCTPEAYQNEVTSAISRRFGNATSVVKALNEALTEVRAKKLYSESPELGTLAKNQATNLMEDIFEIYKKHIPALKNLDIKIGADKEVVFIPLE